MTTELRLDFKCPKTKDDFVASTDGLFCTECQKPVVDFTGMQRAEIARKLKGYNEMPCVWIPEDVLKQPKPVRSHWWSPWRKSAALVGLFLMLGNVKTLFAQTKLPEKNPADKKDAKPIGYQKITFTGTIKDQSGKGISGAEVRFSFLSNTLGKGKTSADGSYEIVLENYGGIREVDIQVYANGYYDQQLENFAISQATHTFSANLQKWVEMKQQTMIAGGIGYSTFSFTTQYFLAETSPLDVFGHNLPRFNTEETTPLKNKLSYEAWVTDMQGEGIPGARIEMHFPNNEAREGIAGEHGKVTMNMQLDSTTWHANIVVSAPGYYSKRVLFYEFDSEKTIIHKLLKKPVPAPEEEPQSVTEAVAPPETAEPQTSQEPKTLPAKENISLFPNPTDETVTVTLPHAQNATLQVLDAQGHILLRKTSYRQPSVVLETANLTPGSYIVLVQCGSVAYSEKLLIAR